MKQLSINSVPSVSVILKWLEGSYSQVANFSLCDFIVGTTCKKVMVNKKIKNNESKDILFIKKVITYYKKYGRHDLIWRKNTSAYRILVSEIMLQQTQVTRVLEKFSLWMKLYPTLSSLRSASLRDVLIVWQGLGYQRRAKALFDIAQQVRIIPKSFEELLNFKGVGVYTASAVCAFAHDSFEHPLLETNIRTALIETFYKEEQVVHDDTLYEVLRRLENNSVIQKCGARTWYYALMDYGAVLKVNKISHNSKTNGYTKQKPYKGSSRELRAKIVFAIAHKNPLPKDKRNASLLVSLEKEGYIVKKGKTYQIS